MRFEKWEGNCKVVAFPWIDGQNIYVNVQYFRAGQSVMQPPVWDKTAYIKDDEAGRRFVFEFTNTMVEAFCGGKIPDRSYVKVG